MTPDERFLQIGFRLHIRQWPGTKEPFVLLHGLASNCRTWDRVAARLSAAGHPVATPDQRGHGLSEKPNLGYDFATITDDLIRLLDVLGWERPLVAGQSWGGNVALEFGARHPGHARGLGFVDGGFIDLQSRPAATWERTSRELRPPDLRGKPRTVIAQLIREAYPDWDEAGIEATLANFETLPDGTVRPWLSLDRHMTILRALWNQRPSELFPKVREPVLICVAEDGPLSPELRREQVAAAEAGLRRAATRWFPHTAHDIHVHRPALLAQTFLRELSNGVWDAGP